MTYVYLIECPELKKTKIGLTGNIKKRMVALQTSMPYRLQLAYILHSANAAYLEKQLHEHFRSHRIEGEWFNLQAREIIAQCSKFKEITTIEEINPSVLETETAPPLQKESSRINLFQEMSPRFFLIILFLFCGWFYDLQYGPQWRMHISFIFLVLASTGMCILAIFATLPKGD